MKRRDFQRTAEDREFIGTMKSLPPERQSVYERLMRLLIAVKQRGDEFTHKRFLKLAQPGVAIDRVLAELERRPPAR